MISRRLLVSIISMGSGRPWKAGRRWMWVIPPRVGTMKRSRAWPWRVTHDQLRVAVKDT